MAQVILCDVCDVNAAIFLVTNLEVSDTFSACGPHFLEWCAAMAANAQPPADDTAPETPEGGAAGPEGEAGTDAPPNGQPKSKPQKQASAQREPESAETAPGATSDD